MLSHSFEAQIPVLRPNSFEAEIWAMRLGFEPQDWDLGLKAGIWASRLRYGPGGWGGGRRRRRRRRRKSPICVKA